jgi:hypothetical protein
MTHQPAPLHPTHSTWHASPAQTRLYGRPLLFTRVGWAALVVLSLSVFVVSLPAFFAQFLEHASQQAAALSRVGLSPVAAARINVATVIGAAVVWCAVAAVIVWRKSNDWLALLIALFLVVLAVAGNDSILSPLTHSASLWRWPAMFLTLLSGLLFLLVVALFPTGQFVPHWMPWLLPLSVVSYFTSPLFLDPLALPAPAWLPALGIFLLAALSLLQLAAPIYRYRWMSGPVERQQIKWIVYAISLILVVFVAGSLPLLIFPSLDSPDSLYLLAFTPVYTLAGVLIPLAFGIAILRHHLWDIDIIIRRTLVYSALTFTLALIYIGCIVVSRSLVAPLTGGSEVAIVASTLAIAALFNPLRRHFQNLIDRRFYRRKYDAAKTLGAFGATVRDETDLNALTSEMLRVVDHTIQPEFVGLWLRDPAMTPSRDAAKPLETV